MWGSPPAEQLGNIEVMNKAANERYHKNTLTL